MNNELEALKIYSKYLQRKLTPKEYREWKESEGYLRWWCAAHRYKMETCEKELTKLSEIERKRNLDAWAICLSLAKKAVYDEFEDNPEFLRNREARQKMEEGCAERRMTELGHIPPTFTKVAMCETCGHVPNKIAGEVKHCPWCETGLFKSLEEEMEELEWKN